MIIVAGEILIDRFPDYERIGGAPFNFAFHLKKMGWPTRFITRIGDDANGRRIQRLLARNNFDPDDVQIDPNHPTGLVKVQLDDQGVPQFDILKDVAYDYMDLSFVQSVDWAAIPLIYFGSLAQRTAHGCEQYQTFLARKGPATRGFCDINLRPPHLNREAVKASLNHTDILKLNTEELDWVGDICNGPQNPEDLIPWIMQTFGIELIALTRGADGSTIITARETISAAPRPIDTIVDTVGAGDAYAAVLANGILDRLPMVKTLDLATSFSAAICALPGAIPMDNQPYENLKIQTGKETP